MDVTGAKRKRSPTLSLVGHQAQVPPPARMVENVGSGMTQINYLMKARKERLDLIEGDSETFSVVLGMLDDYEGVLHRHESLAANLGAKLVGPLLLKSFEKLFDGPIKTVQTSFAALEQSSISWLDIVAFARSNPTEFPLIDNMPAGKCCRFWIKGSQIEISEDDYRLIMSGAPERMIPSQPLPEDESAELGTLNILESRLAILIKKADAVASKARQLNYHLKGRKAAVLSRKAAGQPNPTGNEGTPQQPFSGISSQVTGEGAKLQLELLEQFKSGDRRQSGISHTKHEVTRGSTSDATNVNQNFNGQQADLGDRRSSHPLSSLGDGSDNQSRVVMAAKIEKLRRGDTIYPPCDRCRRLKFDCSKHLTACSACTKKHAKCSWKDSKAEEMDQTPPIPVVSSQNAPSIEDNNFAVDAGEQTLDLGQVPGEIAASGTVFEQMNPRTRNGVHNSVEKVDVDT